MAKVIIEVKTLHNDKLVGRMVLSKAGRDEGNFYIVISQIDENYVLLANGRTKTVEMPKKKKLKHLVLTNVMDEELRHSILSQDKNIDLKIKKNLKLNGIIEEV